MSHQIEKIRSPEECEFYAQKAAKRGRLDLEQEARKRAIELRAAKHNPVDDIEAEFIRAIYAHEQQLFKASGCRARATRVWTMLNRHGVIGALKRAVIRKSGQRVFEAMVSMGLQDYAFEAVVANHPEHFDEETQALAKQRLVLEGPAIDLRDDDA